MKRGLLSLVVLFADFSAHADVANYGLHCGTRGNLWGTIMSDHVIPDYFPPENPLLRTLLFNSYLNLTMCEEAFQPAHLGESCMMHDQCYATLGATKEGCDSDLLRGWQARCDESYAGVSGFLCRTACKGAVKLMHSAMRFKSGNFCPSCEAFEKSQKKARMRS